MLLTKLNIKTQLTAIEHHFCYKSLKWPVDQFLGSMATYNGSVESNPTFLYFGGQSVFAHFKKRKFNNNLTSSSLVSSRANRFPMQLLIPVPKVDQWSVVIMLLLYLFTHQMAGKYTA